MATDLATKKKNLLETASTRLSELLSKQVAAMPKGFNQTRFLQNCMAVLRDTKDIEKFTPEEIALALIRGAYLGLDFFRQECYVVAYGGQLKFQTDYKGEVKLAKMYAAKRIRHLYAKNVREGDCLDIKIMDGNPKVNFAPIEFNDKPVLGAFAVVVYEDGSLEYDTMSLKEIEHVRRHYSKAADGPAWKKSPEEMYKKTVLRRLCKLIHLEFENPDQELAYAEGGSFQLPVEEPDDKTGKINKDPFQASDPEISEAEIVEAQKPAPAVTPEPAPQAWSPEYKKRFDRMKQHNPQLEDWQIEAILSEEDEYHDSKPQ